MAVFQIENRAGESIASGGTKITLISQAVRIQPPGFSGGLIWNRPASVVIQNANGEERVVPIPDVTRLALLAILGMALGGGLLIWLTRRK